MARSVPHCLACSEGERTSNLDRVYKQCQSHLDAFGNVWDEEEPSRGEQTFHATDALVQRVACDLPRHCHVHAKHLRTGDCFCILHYCIVEVCAASPIA